MKQIKINLIQNVNGYYGISYFDKNDKYQHFVVKTLNDAYIFIGEKTLYTAERTFKGNRFEIWEYEE